MAGDADHDAARLVDGVHNRVWLDPLIGRGYPDDVVVAWESNEGLRAVQDGDLDEIGAGTGFCGVNYYHPVLVSTGGEGPAADGVGLDGITEHHVKGSHTTMGWGIDASGLRELLVRLAADYPALPLLVTENGAAFPDAPAPDGSVADDDRVAYLSDHLGAALAARADGVDVRGYFAWTLLDNFEWAEGYAQRFGMVRVDPETLARTPKRSAHWLREVTRERTLP